MIYTKKNLAVAFFDFDGTVTTKDTFLHFIFFVKGRIIGVTGFFILSPILFLYKLKLMPRQRAKEIIFSFFFKGHTELVLRNKGKEFAGVINKMVRPEAIDKIKWHKENYHDIFIVTASSNIWLEEWCKQNSVQLISTIYEVKNGQLTGKIHGKNCYGTEKVYRIKEVCNLSAYQDIYAYGDTKGDLPMLSIAEFKFYCKFY